MKKVEKGQGTLTGAGFFGGIQGHAWRAVMGDGCPAKYRASFNYPG